MAVPPGAVERHLEILNLELWVQESRAPTSRPTGSHRLFVEWRGLPADGAWRVFRGLGPDSEAFTQLAHDKVRYIQQRQGHIRAESQSPMLFDCGLLAVAS